MFEPVIVPLDQLTAVSVLSAEFIVTGFVPDPATTIVAKLSVLARFTELPGANVSDAVSTSIILNAVTPVASVATSTSDPTPPAMVSPALTEVLARIVSAPSPMLIL